MKQKIFLCAAAMTFLILNGCSNQSRYESTVTKQENPVSSNTTDENQVSFDAADESENSPALPNTSLSDQNPADDTRPQNITPEQAKSAALAHAGLSEDQVTFIKNELEADHNHEIYDVEFYTADDAKYDYDIDAFSGEILSYDRDFREHKSQSQADSGSSSNTAITEAQAKDLALAKVPGASAENIREFETDYDDGNTEYEGKIIYNGMEYEFEINAGNGTFHSWEEEPAD